MAYSQEQWSKIFMGIRQTLILYCWNKQRSDKQEIQ